VNVAEASSVLMFTRRHSSEIAWLCPGGGVADDLLHGDDAGLFDV